MTNQPEALRLADELETYDENIIFCHYGDINKSVCMQSAAELRRLHEVNAELLKVLKGVVSNAVDIECGDFILVEPHFAHIKAALAKITGESNA